MFDFHVTNKQADILLTSLSLYLGENDVFVDGDVSRATVEKYRDGLNLRNRLKHDLLKAREGKG